MIKIEVPDFYRIFPAPVNPHMYFAWENAKKWLSSTCLISTKAAMDRLDRHNYADLVARTYPHANLKDLEMAMCWLMWLFIVDDHIDECQLGHRVEEGKRLIKKLLYFIREDIPRDVLPSNAAEISWIDFWNTVSPRMSMGLKKRFIQNTRKYVSSWLWEIEHRANSSIPDLFEYAEMRRCTGAIDTVLDYIEYANFAELDASIVDTYEINTLKNCTVDIISMMNDIFSFQKETQRGEVSNYVKIVCNTFSCGVNDSIRMVNKLQSSRANLFFAIKESLPRFFKEKNLDKPKQEAIMNYVNGLEYWMRGNMDFSAYTARYTEVYNNEASRSLNMQEQEKVLSIISV